jgi:hypothetical protein
MSVDLRTNSARSVKEAWTAPTAALLRRTGTAGVMFLVSWSLRSVKLAVNGRCAAAIVPHDGR